MRKLGQFLILWAALLFYPLSSLALGLGEIEVSSFLNQPLNAEIEVVSARPGEVDDLLVSLASRDAFRKAGLERPSDLSKLRFKVEKSEDGQSAKILITTKTPIKEPFLNFLVEADWAKGRLLREFTVLLDPPYFAQQPEPAATPPTATAAAPAEPLDQAPMEEPASMMTSETEPVSQPIALTDEPAVAEESVPYVEDATAYSDVQTVADEIVVTKGDTLWAIASQYKDDDHSMAQVMLAMQAMNPEAFGQDNINNLKVGSVLRAPDRDALDRFSKQEAYAQVLEQNGLWDEYVARVTGVTTAGSPVADVTGEMASEAATEEGQLSLLTPDEGDSTSASFQTDANAQDAGQIRKQLALAEEELEAAKLENQDLKSRISDLEEQINKFEELQKLVQIEDDSLAQLQQDQVTEETVPEVAADEEMSGMVEEQPTDVMIEAAESMMSEAVDDQEAAEMAPEEEMAPTEEMEVASDDEMIAATEEQAVSDDTLVEGATEQMAEGMDETVATAEPEEQEVATVPAPVIVTEAPESAVDGGILDMLPSMDQLLSDPIMLGGIGAILALLIGFLFLKRKKSGDEEGALSAEEPGESLVDEDATPIHMPGEEDIAAAAESVPEPLEEEGVVDTEQHMADTLAVEPEEEVAEVDEEEMNKTAVLSADELPSVEEAPAEQDDVLNEVDVYLAYGLYDNAEELLKDSLQDTPERADYRAKLLDTYFATKNADGFVQEAESLKSLGSAADRFWDRVQIMGYELAPSNELFADAKDSDLSVEDLEYAKPDTADFDIGAEEDITDFSNTDFDLSEDADNFELTDTQVVPPGIEEGVEEEKIDHFSETQSLEDADLPDLDDVEDLPDEIGDFDLDLGSDAETDADADEVLEDEDALSFDLPEDLDLSTGGEDDSLIPLDPTVEAPDLDEVPPMDETDAVVLDFDTSDSGEEDDESEIDLAFGAEDVDDSSSEEESEAVVDESTVAMSSVEKAEAQIEPEGTRHIEAALDMDMSDLESADLSTGNWNVDDDADITEFKPADMTEEFTTFDPEADAAEQADAAEEVDVSAGVDKTGTFAPGDFDDATKDSFAAIEESGEIEDLMLPDDVDEVSTKLDLAKAFIDMGDAEGAKSSLEEVLSEGTQEQKAEATGLLNKIN